MSVNIVKIVKIVNKMNKMNIGKSMNNPNGKLRPPLCNTGLQKLY